MDDSLQVLLETLAYNLVMQPQTLQSKAANSQMQYSDGARDGHKQTLALRKLWLKLQTKEHCGVSLKLTLCLHCAGCDASWLSKAAKAGLVVHDAGLPGWLACLRGYDACGICCVKRAAS